MRLIRSLAIVCTALAVSSVASASWAQEASPSPSPSPSGSATPAPSPSESPMSDETPSPSPSPSATPTPTTSPTPTPAGPTPTPVASAGEVSLEVEASRTALRVGQETTIDVAVTNGTNEAQDLTLSVELPEQLGYVSSDPPGVVVGGGPPPWGDAVAIDLGSVAAGTTATATLELEALQTAPPGGVQVLFGVSGSATSLPVTLVVDIFESNDEIPGALTLTASAPPDPLAQVGDRLTYALTVSNTGDGKLEDVIVVERVAPEIHVLAAPLVDGVDAVQIGRFLAKEDIVWVLEELDPGERVRMPWRGVVQSAGDLEVTTSARATAARAEPVTASAANFLASPDAPSAPLNPPFVPIRKRVAIEVPADLPAPGSLPFTGLTAWAWALIGGAIVLAGLTLYRLGSPLARGKRIPAALLLVSIMAAACVSSSDNERRPQAGGTPEVKGQRVERGNDDRQGPNDEGRTGGDPGENATGDPEESDESGDRPEGEEEDDPLATDVDQEPAIPPPPDEPAPVPPPLDPGTETRIVVRELTLSDLPIIDVPSTSGSSASFTWDEPSRSVTSKTSSRLFVEGSPISVVTTIHDDGVSISADVSLLNLSEDERVAVRGRLVHEVGEGGGLARLTSAPIDTVLSPGGRVTATFRYLLPSGAYQAGGSFVST